MMGIIKYLINSTIYLLLKRRACSESGLLRRNHLVASSNVFYFNKEQHCQFDGSTHKFIPQDFEQKFPWIRDFKHEFKIDKPWGIVLEKIELVGKRAIPVSKRGQIILEGIGNSVGYLLRSGDGKFIIFRKLFKPRRFGGVVISLVDSLSRNYYHWINDMLPLLEAVDCLPVAYSSRVTIIIDHNPPEFQREFLNLLGYADTRIKEWQYNRVQVEQLIIVSRRYHQVKDGIWAKYHVLSKSGYDWLRSRLVSNQNRKIGRRVYISRDDAASRKILNENEIVSYLNTLDFEKVILSDLSVVMQIQLFKEADIIVAAHGAALVNAVFGDELSIIELFPENRFTESTNCFYQLAHFYHHKYYVLACDVMDELENMNVPIDGLKQVVESITAD